MQLHTLADQNEDLVEMYRDGEWGLIRAVNLNIFRSGDLICQMLGYKKSTEINFPYSSISSVTYKFCYALDDCTGKESLVNQCINNGYTTDATSSTCPFLKLALSCAGTLDHYYCH